jgi:transposase-like protein
MECPRCGSQNVKTFEMTHASYNVGISSWTRFVRLMYFGPLTLLIKPTRNTVARTTSPPEKPIPVLALVFAFLFLSTLIWLIIAYRRDGLEDHETQTALVINAILFVVGLIIAVWDISRCIRVRSRYPQRFDEWIHSWICLQCGRTYKVPNATRT